MYDRVSSFSDIADRWQVPAGIMKDNRESMQRERVCDILAQAMKSGASAAEADAMIGQGFSVAVRQGEVDTMEFSHDQNIRVAVYFGYRKGVATTADGSPEAVRRTVQAAVDIARHTEEDQCNGLAEETLMARNFPDLQLHHPWPLKPSEARDMALEMERIAQSVDTRITNSDGVEVSTHESVHAYGNSHDFMVSGGFTHHGLSCVMVGEQDGHMQRDGYYSVARNPVCLQSLEQVGRLAGERTSARLGARRISTARLPVLFTPECARSLLGHLVAAISGGNLYRKASFLLDSLGQQILPERYSLYEDPYIPGAIGSAAVDGDGLQTRRQAFVDGGELTGFVLSVYSARRLDMTPNACAGGVHNLCVSDDGVSPDEMMAEMGRGLLVTELMGQGVNPVTGDYSRGAVGFLIEEGKIARPVEEVTVAGNLATMYRHIRAIGNDVDKRGNIRTGSIWIDGMTVAGS